MNNKTQEKYHQQKNRKALKRITSFNIINENIVVKYNLWVILAYSG